MRSQSLSVWQRRQNRGGQRGARPRNAETAGAKVSFRPSNNLQAEPNSVIKRLATLNLWYVMCILFLLFYCSLRNSLCCIVSCYCTVCLLPLTPRTPLRELTALPKPSSWWGKGLQPPPQEPHTRLSQHRRSPASAICWPWPARRSSSQTVNIRRTPVLLCRTFSLERSSWLLNKRYTFSVYFQTPA